MKKRNQAGGIVVKKVKTAGETSGGFFSVFLCILMGAAAGAGSFGVLADGFSLSVSFGYVLPALLLSAAVFGAACGAARYRRTFLAVFFLFLAVTAFGLRDTLAAGLRSIGFQILEVYGEHFGFGVRAEIPENIPPERLLAWRNMAAAYVMILQQLVLALFLSSGKRRALPAILATLPFFAAPLAAGLVPAPGWLLLLFLAWGLMICGGRALRASQAAVWTCVMVLITILTGVVLPEERYVRPAFLEDLRTGLLTGADLSAMLRTEGIGGRGGLVDLSASGDLHFSENVMLKVKMAKNSPDYLKGFVGSIYEDQSWSELPEEVYEAPGRRNVQNYPYLYLQHMPVSSDYDQYYYDITIHNVGTDPRVVYIPYGLMDTPGELEEIRLERDMGAVSENSLFGSQRYQFQGVALSDAYLTLYQRALERHGTAGEGQWTIGWDALNTYEGFLAAEEWEPSGEFLSSLGQEERDFLEEAVRYRDFVYETYTQVPEELSGFLTGYLEEQDLDVRNAENPLDYAVQVAGTVQYENVYTLTPGATPEGEDFVEYFLTENHRGYCRHFASSVCLLLRASGIPARYVEGYVASPWGEKDQDGWILLRDSDAHAWVEIYASGLGWIPLETTGSARDDLPLTEPETEETAMETTEEETAAQERPPETETDGEEESGGEQPVPESRTPFFILLAVPVILLVPAAALLLNRGLRLAARRRKFRGKDRNRAALAVYGAIRELDEAMTRSGRERETGWEEKLEQARRTAQKARFSPHRITRTELQELLRMEGQLRAAAKKEISGFRKLYFRFIRGLF